jgi:hypothetical protein
MDRQLWKEQGCFAHVLGRWQHQELARFGGVVFATGRADGDLMTVPDAVVYVRPYGGGDVLKTSVQPDSSFRCELPEGVFEVAVCAVGRNPWRGTVRVKRDRQAKQGVFLLELAQ